MRDSPTLRAYLELVGPLLDTDEVQSMGQWNHHFGVTTYEHSLFVSYVAYRMARALGMDCYAAARAGLLHDLYLYSPYRDDSHPGNQCFYHPIAALKNAKALVPDLTEAEENSIVSHMWPLAYHMPKCRLALVISAADKLCAMLEITKLYHLMGVRKVMPPSRYAMVE